MKRNKSLKGSILFARKSMLFILIIFASFRICFCEVALKNVNFLPVWVPQPQFAGYYMAKEKGIYQKYGLNVNIINGCHKNDANKLLLNGDVDIAIMFLTSAINHRIQGADIVNIAQIFQKSGILFVTRKSSGIDSISDFKGKRIAIWRTVFNETTDGFLKENGIDNIIYRINGGVNLFLKGAIDVCVVMEYNELNTLYNHGMDPEELNIFDLNRYGFGFLEDGLYMTGDRYKNDPEMASAFVKASIEGWMYALENMDETIEVMLRLQKAANVISNRVHTEWMLKSTFKMIFPEKKLTEPGILDKNDFMNALEFMTQYLNTTNKIDYLDFFKGVR